MSIGKKFYMNFTNMALVLVLLVGRILPLLLNVLMVLTSRLAIS